MAKELTLQDIADAINETNRRIDATNKHINETSGETHELTRALSVHMDERFAKMDERFAQVDERFAKMDERFDHMESRIETLEHDMHAGFRSIRGDIAELDRKSLSLVEQDELWKRIRRIEAKVGLPHELELGK